MMPNPTNISNNGALKQKLPISTTKNALNLCFFFSGVTGALLFPMIPMIQDMLHIGNTELSLLFFSGAIGAIIGLLVANLLIVYYGSKSVIVWGTLCSSLMVPWIPILKSVEAFGTIFFFLGIVGTAVGLAINHQATHVEASLGKPSMSTFHGLGSLGSIIGASCSALILKYNLNLLLFLTSVSMMSFILLFSYRTYLFNKEVEATQKLAIARPSKSLLLIGLLCFIMALSENGIQSWGPVFLKEIHHYSNADSGIGYVVFIVAMTLGRLVGDPIRRSFGSEMTLKITVILTILGFMLSTYLADRLCLVAFAVIGLGMANIAPILFSAAGRLPVSSKNFSLFICILAGVLGGIISPILIGFVADTSSLKASFIVLALSLLIIFICTKRVVNV